MDELDQKIYNNFVWESIGYMGFTVKSIMFHMLLFFTTYLLLYMFITIAYLLVLQAMHLSYQ